ANIITPLFGGIPATGAIARTATNIKSGAVSPFSGIFQSVFVLLTLLLFSPYASYIPLASMAPILMVVAYNMSEYQSFKANCKILICQFKRDKMLLPCLASTCSMQHSGVLWQFKDFLGILFLYVAPPETFSWDTSLKSISLGSPLCRRRPLECSFKARCEGV